MNKIFKVIYSKTRHCYVVVSELAKSHCKTAGSHTTRNKTALTAAVLLTLGAFSFIGMPTAEALTDDSVNDYFTAYDKNYFDKDGNRSTDWKNGEVTNTDQDSERVGAKGTGAIAAGLYAQAGQQTVTIGNRNAGASMGSVYVGEYKNYNTPTSASVPDGLGNNYVTSVGFMSNATKYGTVAIGANASAEGEVNDIKFGETDKSGTYMHSLPENPNITGASVALGYSAKATAGNIAIGAYSDTTTTTSATETAYTKQKVANSYVSIGNSTTQRRITNVADGADATDVATVGQLQALSKELGGYKAGFGIKIDPDSTDTTKNTISLNRNLGTNYTDEEHKGDKKVTVTADDTGLVLGGYAEDEAGNKNNPEVTYGATGDDSVTVGGKNGLASGKGSVAAGGMDNVASGVNATVVGGDYNDATGKWSAALGGRDNTASGEDSTASGGSYNVANGMQSAVLGGYSNNALGTGTTSIGGYGKDYDEHNNVIYDSSVNGNYSVSLAGGSTGKDAMGALAAGHQAVVTTANGTAIGYQATTDEAGTIAFGHDAGDVSGYTIKWKQRTDGKTNADNTTNDYTQAPESVTENTYTTAAYNRLVKVADGIEDHDVVVMEQLKDYTKTDASNIGNNIKVYKTDGQGNVQLDNNKKPIENTEATKKAQQTNQNDWGAAIGNGVIANPEKEGKNDPTTNGSQQLVTGGTVYKALQQQANDLKVNAGWGINIADEKDEKTGTVTKKNVISLNRNLGTNYGVTKHSNSKGKVTFETQGKNSLILGGSAINDTWYAYENDKNKYLDHAYGTFQDDSVLVGGVNNATGSKGEKTPSDHKGSVVVGGAYNIASGNYALISGGSENLANGGSSAILGGYQNEIPDSDRAIYSTIVGGTYNIASGIGATAVGGGNDIYNSLQYQNKASGSYSTTVGGEGNEASGDHSVTVGGINNKASGSSAIVIGGTANEAGIANKRSSDTGAIIIGGRYNVNNGWDSVIFGGNSNVVNGTTSSIMGGAGNVASGTTTTVGGGLRNVAAGVYSAAFGGYQSFVGGELSTGIAGGSTADNAYLSLAAGYQSVVTNNALVREGFSVSEEKGRELLAKVKSGEASGYYEASPLGGGEYWVTHYKNISTALGYQATADESGTIALGHDKGDTLITYKWPQKAWKSGDSYWTYNENTGGIDTISEEEYQKLQNSDGTWNDYTASPTAETGTYDTAYYNRLVKAADGKDAHDVVVMEQLTPYTKSDASNIGANLKTYTVGDDGETITQAEASDADKTKNKNAWGAALGTGKVADPKATGETGAEQNGSEQLVTGGAVFNETRISAKDDQGKAKTYNYLDVNASAGKNLEALDSALKTVSDSHTALTVEGKPAGTQDEKTKKDVYTGKNILLHESKDKETGKVTYDMKLSKDIVLGEASEGKGGSLNVYSDSSDANNQSNHVSITGSTISVNYPKVGTDGKTTTDTRGVILGVGEDSQGGADGYIAFNNAGGGYTYLHSATDAPKDLQNRLEYVGNDSHKKYIANLDDGITFAGDVKNTVPKDSTQTSTKFNTTINVVGGAKTKDDLTEGNIGVVSTPAAEDEKGNQTQASKLEIKLNKDLKGINSISNQTTKDGTTTGAKINLAANGTTTISGGDVNVDGNKVTGLKDGENDTDAVTVKQLNGKANVDASNIGAKLKSSDGKSNASTEEITANKDAWGKALGAGTFTTGTSDKATDASTSDQLVTGKTLYDYDAPVAAAGKSLTYVSANNTTGQNLSALDAQVKANADELDKPNHNIKFYSVDDKILKYLPKVGNYSSNEANDGAKGMGSMAAGVYTHSDGIASTVAGFYSGVINSKTDGLDLRGATALSYGAFNFNQNTDTTKTYSGVANSIVGQANATTDSNAAIIYGAGNTVTNSYRKIDDANASEIMQAALSKDVKKLDEALQKAVPNSGAQVMVMGGGNTVDKAYMTQVTGVGNKVTGADSTYAKETSTQYNFVDGFQNELSNGKHDYIIGSNNKVSGDSVDKNQSNIIFGDNHKLTDQKNNVIIGSSDKADDETTVSDIVAIGHNAKVSAEGGVAIGSGSAVAAPTEKVSGYDPTTKAQSTDKTSHVWNATTSAVSIGTADGTVTRQLNGVAAGTNDTDAVNVAQLKKLGDNTIQYDLNTNKGKITLAGQQGTTITNVKSALDGAKDAEGKDATIATATGDALKNAANLGDLQKVYNDVNAKASAAHTALTVEGGMQAGTQDEKTKQDVYAGKNILLHESTDATTGKVTYDLKLSKDINIGKPGKDGEDGKIGIDGKDGHIGLNGSDGITVRGLDGKDGAPGKDGVTITGPKGADGTDGKVGISGKDGKDAVSISGKDGVGHIGLTGPAGTNGMNGADGKPGTSIDITVKNGYDGKTGTDGKDGVKGEKGVDGTSLTRIVYTDKTGEHQVATMEDGLKFKGDDTTVINKKLNNTLEIIGGAKGKLTEGNIGVISKDGKLNVQLAKVLTKITSISNQTTTGEGDQAKTTGAKIDLGDDGNISVNGGKITNVGSGIEKGTDDKYTVTDANKTNAANIGDVDNMVKQAVDGLSNTTDTKLADKANVNASNVGANISGSDEQKKANEEAWGDALGKGEIKAGEKRLVTGDTVAKAIGDEKTAREAADQAINEKIGTLDKDGNYIKKDDSISKNLSTLDGQVSKISSDVSNLSDNAVQYDKDTNKSKVTLAGEGGTTIDNVKDGTLTENGKEAVNGGQLWKVDQKVENNTTEINKIKNGDFTDASKTAIHNIAKDAVEVVGGVNTTVKKTEGTDKTPTTYAVNVEGTGKVVSGDTGLISGDTLYKEVHVDKDGSYIKGSNTVGQNLSALDTGLKTTSDLIHTNDKGDTIQIGGNSTATKIDVSGKDANGNTTGRVITGVVSDANDPNSAANVGYVNGLTAANTQQIYRDMNNAYSRLDTNINRAAAGSNALAALHPLDFDPADKASFAVGYGHYHNANAAAVGAFYQPNANTMVNMGISLGNGDPGFNAGVSFKIGKGSAYNGVSKAEMAQTIHDQAAEISTIKANDAAKDKRIDALEKENQEMKKQIQEILARLNG